MYLFSSTQLSSYVVSNSQQFTLHSCHSVLPWKGSSGQLTVELDVDHSHMLFPFMKPWRQVLLQDDPLRAQHAISKLVIAICSHGVVRLLLINEFDYHSGIVHSSFVAFTR